MVLKEPHTVVCHGSSQVPSSASVGEFPFVPHPLHNLLFVAFLTKAILTLIVRLYLMVLWISISQTLGDVDSFSWDLFRML